MAYSGYGAFVYRNGVRRRDREDVGVFDDDESNLPSGARIWANLTKNRAAGQDAWYQHSQHGVMGDGPVRVACYKQGLPSSAIYYWPSDAPVPESYAPQTLTATPPMPIPTAKYQDEPQRWGAYFQSRWDYEYGTFTVVKEFPFLGTYTFTFTDHEHSESGHYEATMTEPDGTSWLCVYDYEYGAGWTDEDEENSKTTYMNAALRAFQDQEPE